jgi:HEAT repeat protein
MSRALKVGVGIAAILAAALTLRGADPEKKEVVFEERLLHCWLEECFDTEQYDIEVQEKAKEALGRFCADPEKATPALTAALADRNEHVRRAATIFLGRYCESEASWATPPLLKTLETDKSILVRAAAADALRYIDPKSETVQAALIKALKEDRAERVREAVVRNIRWMELRAAVPALTVALKDSGTQVRFQAAFALKELGEPKTVIPLLVGALDDQNAGEYIAAALGGLCPEAIPSLQKAMEDKKPLVRAGALRALAEAKEDARPLIRKELPAIIALLDDKDDEVRCNAARTVGIVSKGTKSGVPALIAKLDDADESLRLECIYALGVIGRDAGAAVEKLIKLLKHPRTRLRWASAYALGRIGPAAKTAVPALMEAMNDEDQWVRGAAIHALGDIGPEAKAAVPKLKEALKSAEKEIRRGAEVALKQIESDP